MKLFAFILLTLSLVAFAQDKEDKFSQRKEKALAKIDQRISILQNGKACISNATAKEQLKDCLQKLKSERKEKRKK